MSNLKQLNDSFKSKLIIGEKCICGNKTYVVSEYFKIKKCNACKRLTPC